ncbi:Hint domain-containing protein [Streptomyces sioyaensis]|uniref:Hint domain-containing protein n=1 Tax=Streptomyces sioyaensis TaxID=67364 RepID=UPI003D75FD4D
MPKPDKQDYIKEGQSWGLKVGAGGGAVLGGIAGAAGGPAGVIWGASIGAAGGALFGHILGGAYGAWTAPGCFIRGTLVATGEGLLPIDSIEAGQKVHSFNSTNCSVVVNKVLQVFESRRQEILAMDLDGETICCTPEHRFRRSGQWVPASELKPGDRLLNREGRQVELKDVNMRIDPQSVFNINVEGAHNYFVGKSGLLVHNLKKAVPQDTPEGPDHQ